MNIILIFYLIDIKKINLIIISLINFVDEKHQINNL